MTDADLIQEIADRARRTETRVTKIANSLGIDAGGERPQLSSDGTRLQVPSRKVSLDDLMAAIPRERRNHLGVDVYCGEDYIATVSWP